MEKMIIHGGAPLRGTVTLSGSKNAALPIMMASLLTSEPLHLSNVPRLRDVKTAMDLLSQLGVAGAMDRRASRRAARGEGYLARGVVRAGQDDARVVRGAGAAAGADRTRARVDAGRMRDWRAAGESAYRGDSRARQQDPVSPRLRRGACREADGRTHLARFAVGRRHRKYFDGGGDCARAHGDRKRGARARGAGPRASAGQDGREDQRRGHARDRSRRRRAAAWRRA